MFALDANRTTTKCIIPHMSTCPWRELLPVHSDSLEHDSPSRMGNDRSSIGSACSVVDGSRSPPDDWRKPPLLCVLVSGLDGPSWIEESVSGIRAPLNVSGRLCGGNRTWLSSSPYDGSHQWHSTRSNLTCAWNSLMWRWPSQTTKMADAVRSSNLIHKLNWLFSPVKTRQALRLSTHLLRWETCCKHQNSGPSLEKPQPERETDYFFPHLSHSSCFDWVSSNRLSSYAAKRMPWCLQWTKREAEGSTRYS